MPTDAIKLWKTGFGTVTGKNLLDARLPLMGGIFLANFPQALLSYIYLVFNALFTSMFIAREWSNFGVLRKSLRVTLPFGQQRETYWLNIPFRYAIPMTVVSAVFHWFASQSIFLVQISVTNVNTRDNPDQVSTCGYSPVAVILTAVTATFIALCGVSLGRLKLPVGIPLASSCSAAISAACHPPAEDVNASLMPVQWGAVTHIREGDADGETIGHCSFSSFPVEIPITGRLYA